MQDILYPIQDLLESLFSYIPMLGNIPNVIFIIGGILGLSYWVKMQSDFNKKDEKDGYIK